MGANRDNDNGDGNSSSVPQAKIQAAGFYRTMLGNFEITVLSDGTAPRPVGKIMSKSDEVRAMLVTDHETLPIQLLMNAFLIKTGEKLMYVDKRDPESSGSPARHRIC